MDKNSSFVILNKKDYIAKLENIVKHGIDKGTYVMTENNTIKDLKPTFFRCNLAEKCSKFPIPKISVNRIDTNFSVQVIRRTL